MKKLCHLGPALAVSLILALSGQPALAQRHGGGRHGGSGGHRGSGYAVPRSGGGHHYGGVAGARHPRPGGSYGHSYGHSGRYYGHRGGHYPYYGHRYYPYYGYRGGYYPYYGYYGRYYGYGPYSYGSLYFGWPYSYSWSYSVGDAYYPSDSMGDYAPAPDYGSDERASLPVREVERSSSPAADRDSGSLRLEVRPEDASVYVDDRFRGTAREARGLRLAPGSHAIELVRPGYVTERRELQIVTGEKQDLFVEMQRPR